MRCTYTSIPLYPTTCEVDKSPVRPGECHGAQGACLCRLHGGDGNQRREMAVVFYVDPSIANDHDNDGLGTITLSYTFYPVRDPVAKPLASGDDDKRKGNL